MPWLPFSGASFCLAGARPRLGLAFAAALSVHLGIVASLCVIGHAPDLHTFVIFGVAAGFTYLLALLSIRQVRQALPQKLWLLIRTVATN